MFDFKLIEHAIGQQSDSLLQGLGIDYQLSIDRTVFGEMLYDALQERELLTTTVGILRQLLLIDRRGLFAAFWQLILDIFRFGIIVGHLGQAVKPVAGEPPPSPPSAECR